MHLELEQRIVNTMKGSPPFVRMRCTLWWCGVGHRLWVISLYMYHSAVGLDSNTKMATLWENYLVWCPYFRKTNKFEKSEGCSFLQMEPWNVQRFVLKLPIDIEIDTGFECNKNVAWMSSRDDFDVTGNTDFDVVSSWSGFNPTCHPKTLKFAFQYNSLKYYT